MNFVIGGIITTSDKTEKKLFLVLMVIIYFYLLQGRKYRRISLKSKSENQELEKLRHICSEGRSKLIETLSDFDDSMADQVLADETGGIYDDVTPECIDQVK